MHKFSLSGAVAALALLCGPAMADFDGMPDGEQEYTALVQLWDKFLDWRDQENPDYSAAAMDDRLQELGELQRRLDDFAVVDWPLIQQVDFIAVRAKLDEQEFTLRVSRPWSRDPGFYVDRMLRVTFTELPVAGDAMAELSRQLDAIPELVADGKNDLTDVAADYADLAIFNLSNADGVGHGFPYRAEPPPGVLGWYEDLLGRARTQQPELVDRIETAGAAVESFRDWLVANRPAMTADAGVGKAAFDWYLKHVKLMPYTSDEIVTLGQRELDRLWAMYALERHRNRNVPEIQISESEEEYQSRIDETDAIIRRFLVEEAIITDLVAQ